MSRGWSSEPNSARSSPTPVPGWRRRRSTACAAWVSEWTWASITWWIDCCVGIRVCLASRRCWSAGAGADMAAVIDRDATLQGHYAGISTRFASFIVDILAIALAFAVAAQAFDYLVSAVFGRDFSLRDATLASDLLLAGWAWFYLAYPIAMGGRTLGMALFGLKIVRADGDQVRTRHAVVRAAVLPLSFLLLGFGFLL